MQLRNETEEKREELCLNYIRDDKNFRSLIRVTSSIYVNEIHLEHMAKIVLLMYKTYTEFLIS